MQAVTADGKMSAQFEHTMVVTEDGVELLTARTDASPRGPHWFEDVADPALAGAVDGAAADAEEK
jgi:hypothetical protein